MAQASPPSMTEPAPAAGGPGTDSKSWRDKLPRVPDAIDIDLKVGRKQAFFGWLGLSLVLIAVGVFLNFTLTDGAWVLPDQDIDNRLNPLGETPVYFFSFSDLHPYDLLTTSLFVGATLLLGLSVLPFRDPRSARYGWGAFYARVTAPLVARRHGIRAAGWVVFAFHWAATAINYFIVENGDWVNMIFAFASVFVLTYFAYQEAISRRLGKDNPSLHFAAAAVFVAATVWYAFLRVEFLSQWIIEVVTQHTVWMLHLFGQEVVVNHDGRTGFLSAITYPNQPYPVQRTVIIILACTAIQSMMIFVAAALAVQKAEWRRRALVIGVTVPIVYILNLLRNVSIIFMWQTRWVENTFGISGDQAFSIAHNWIGKVGSLAALIIIALFVFRVLPEVVHAVVGLLDLPRRRGPLEHFYHGLPAGSILRAAGVAAAVAGLAWALAAPLDGGLLMVAGLVIFLLGHQRARRARLGDGQTPVPDAEA